MKTNPHQPAHLQENDRIVFLGDSITEQHLYTNYVETYLACRYPEMNLSFFNAGWGGDTAPVGLQRLERDVLALKPTIVTICYGMNDGRYSKLTKENNDAFANGIEGLVKALKKLKIRIILLTPGAVDEDRNPMLKQIAYNKKNLRVFADNVLEIAQRNKIPSFDIHGLMVEVHKKAKKSEPEFTMIPDSVHPDPAGHLVMAFGLLKALGVPDYNNQISFDLGNDVSKAGGNLKSGVRVDLSTGSLHIETHLDKIPFYVEPSARKILPYLPFQQTFNSILLKVNGLKPGSYFLRANPERSESFDTKALEKGVNILSFWQPSPMQDAARILQYTNEKDQIYYKLWRPLGFTINTETYDKSVHNIGINVGPQLDKSRKKLIKIAQKKMVVNIHPASLPGEQIDNGDFISTWSFSKAFSGDFHKDYIGNESTITNSVPKPDSKWSKLALPLDDMGNNLGRLIGQLESCCIYAVTIINSEVKQECEICLGSDDGFALWLNGKSLASMLDLQRGVVPDQDTIPAILQKGKNVILVKISQGGSNWGFCMRFKGLSQLVSATRT